MKRTLTIIILLISAMNLCGQDQHVIDSVIPLLKHNGSAWDMEIFYELGYQYAGNDYERSITFLDSTSAIANKLGDSLMIVKSSRMKAQILRREGRLLEGSRILESVLPVAIRQGYVREAGMILMANALINSYMARFDVALDNNLRALEWWRKEGDSTQMCWVLNNIGFTHYQVGNYDRALDYYQQGLLIAERGSPAEFSRVRGLLQGNIGTTYIEMRKFSEGREWLEKSLADCSGNCSIATLINSEFGLGYMANYLSDYRMAKAHFGEAHRLSKNTDARFEAETLNYLGQIARMENDLSGAHKILIDAQRLCIAGHYRSLLAFNYKELSLLYMANKQYEQSSQVLEKYVELYDSIFSDAIRNRIGVMQVEFDKKEHAAALAYKEELLARQKEETWLMGVICVLAVLLAIAFFILFRLKKRTTFILDKRVAERTRELELHKEALERSHAEQRELISKTAQSIKNVAATQKGLSAISENNIIMQKMEEELHELNEEIAKAQNMSDSTGTK